MRNRPQEIENRITSSYIDIKTFPGNIIEYYETISYWIGGRNRFRKNFSC